MDLDLQLLSSSLHRSKSSMIDLPQQNIIYRTWHESVNRGNEQVHHFQRVFFFVFFFQMCVLALDFNTSGIRGATANWHPKLLDTWNNTALRKIQKTSHRQKTPSVRLRLCPLTSAREETNGQVGNQPFSRQQETITFHVSLAGRITPPIWHLQSEIEAESFRSGVHKAVSCPGTITAYSKQEGSQGLWGAEMTSASPIK